MDMESQSAIGVSDQTVDKLRVSNRSPFDNKGSATGDVNRPQQSKLMQR
jgi:hypothetical protein